MCKKIILSRKGFDSTYGGYPSPILPDGTLLSIPIPDCESNIKYNGLKYGNGKNYFDIMESLYKKEIKIKGEWKQITKDTSCHLDPDLNINTLSRSDNWRPLFGPMYKKMTTHLAVSKKVSIGDIFLFFGWFRRAKLEPSGMLGFDKEDKKGRHIIFGYLQVGDIVVSEDAKKYLEEKGVCIEETKKWKNCNDFLRNNKWAKHHPHFQSKKETFVYVANKELSFGNNMKGAGVFEMKDDDDKEYPLVLTKKGESISKWNKISPFVEQTKRGGMSYHSEKNVKTDYFQSQFRGQEFVIDADDQVIEWAKKTIYNNRVVVR